MSLVEFDRPITKILTASNGHFVGRDGVAEFRVVMNNGQMAPVPWFEAVDENGNVLRCINSALVESVDYALPTEGDG